jgi:hypothetical protein
MVERINKRKLADVQRPVARERNPTRHVRGSMFQTCNAGTPDPPCATHISEILV